MSRHESYGRYANDTQFCFGDAHVTRFLSHVARARVEGDRVPAGTCGQCTGPAPPSGQRLGEGDGWCQVLAVLLSLREWKCSVGRPKVERPVPSHNEPLNNVSFGLRLSGCKSWGGGAVGEQRNKKNTITIFVSSRRSSDSISVHYRFSSLFISRACPLQPADLLVPVPVFGACQRTTGGQRTVFTVFGACLLFPCLAKS